MIFKIKKTSDCICAQDGEEVEINSLAELKELQSKMGHTLIIDFFDNEVRRLTDPKPIIYFHSIEIYDGYRE